MRAFLFTAVLALSACNMGTGIVQQSAEEIARGQAKQVVNGVVQTRFPGVNAAPITDCIIDNATLPEIFEIAKGAATGTTPAATQVVIGIAQRPATITCMTQAGLGLLGAAGLAG